MKEAFALIVSRSFGSDWSVAGGASYSEFMCGLGYGNHHRETVSNVETPMVESVFRNTYVEEYLLKNIKKKVGEIEYSSIYWYIDSEIKKGDEVFHNYGNHNSAEMLALFGFVDNDLTEDEDYYMFYVEVLQDDENYACKVRHFDKYWPDQDVLTKHPAVDYGRTITLNGQKNVSVDKEMSNNMRLTFLPNEYFDSFTISSIINGFETNYVTQVIDPLIEYGLHRACAQLLEEYDTDYDEDAEELEQVQKKRDEIKRRMEDKNEDRVALQDELWKFDMNDQVLRYRMREKQYLMDCSYLRLWLEI